MIPLTLELSNILNPHGFVRRGTAFFRVHGDGILQVVKFNRECSGIIELYIGLFSMYSELESRWFTSAGCIPRYPVVNVIGKRCTGVFQHVPSYKDSISAQLHVLREEGILWLNQITTQKQLSEGIRFLETSWGGSYIWNDSFKIAPYLVSGEWDDACHVLQAIINQHKMAYRVNRAIFTTEDAYQEYLQSGRKEDQALYDLMEMIERKERTEIQQYLQRNYDNNALHARFCLK